MAPSTRSGNNGSRDIQIQSSNHSIEKYFDSTKPPRKKSKGKGKGLVRCANNNGNIQISDDILSEVIFKKLPLTSLCTSTESFGVFQGPNSETPIKRVKYMFELEGCLCLAVIRCADDEILDLWLLKGEYNVNSGWVLIASVTKPQGNEIFWNCPYLIRTGELLLAKCEEQGSQSFYVYSLFTRQFRNIKICGHDSYYYVLDNFKENLASLKDFW
ncbi:hypothetical protein FRX31_028962 [Thalictrum thalictroides]|uniref:F-box protein n=1 Tax=Thalictrum thalictroides TaxID=46969 RepID=A0A7J6V8M7_THATH|nr:hypothetical protein FRX31_028962 [Thalictrum thalictroides]